MQQQLEDVKRCGKTRMIRMQGTPCPIRPKGEKEGFCAT